MNANFHFRKLARYPVAVLLLAGVQPVQADAYLGRGHSLFDSTYLIEITQETSLSQKARGMRSGGYETSGGNWVGFGNWYSTNWSDTRISWITQVNPNFGVIWGLSSGERAEKHRIDPGLRLGVLFQTQPRKHSLLTLSASTVVGGKLREEACVADYGEIGGVQKVNCRLAASVLEPSETLNHLLIEKPESSIQIQYRFFFF